MKLFVVIILLVVAALFFALKGDGKGKKAVAKPSAPVNVEKVKESSSAPQQKAKQKGSTVGEEVNSVINYGIGATQLKAKQKSEGKLKQIQKLSNDRTSKALQE